MIAPGHDSGPDDVIEEAESFHVVEKQGDEAALLRGAAEEEPSDA